ncbi:MAG: alkaline shock response membrane anchor protein AmaP [Candidatus Sumerlaeaceae bacterium]|nr:alkaline shock response membrane anchor protein AmaP [Candidatus Sumerlaeaceae bacterium]
MKFLRDLIVVFLLVLVACVSVVGIMVEFPFTMGALKRIPDMGNAIVAAWRTGHGLFWMWTGAFTGILVLIGINLSLTRRHTSIDIETEEGRVSIMDTAIKRYVVRALGEVPGVTTRRVTLRQGRGGLRVDLLCQVKSHDRLPDIKNRMTERVRAALTEDLGITSIAAIDVVIQEFEVRAKSEPVSASPSGAVVADSKDLDLPTEPTAPGDGSTAYGVGRSLDSEKFVIHEQDDGSVSSTGVETVGSPDTPGSGEKS